jgi:hypothetical protein
MPLRLRPDFVVQVVVLLLGVALAVFAADLNSWVLGGLGPEAVRTWKHDLGMPFELLWCAGLLCIGFLAGLVTRPTRLSRIRAFVLLAGPFGVSALVGGLLAVFVFGVHSRQTEAAFMLLYSAALPLGVLLSVWLFRSAESAA